MTLLLWIYAVRTEVCQCKSQHDQDNDFKDYFKSYWNWFDILGLSINFFLIVLTLLESDLLPLWELKLLAGIHSCLIFIKLFDWLRLFEQTGFYVHLIGLLISKIKYFVILVLVSLCMFGIPLAMIQLDRKNDEQLIDDVYGEEYWFLNMLLNQGMAAMGKSDDKNYADKDGEEIIFIFFFLSTFFIKTTMMSMLIAIMCDVFDLVIENKDVNSYQTKL